MRTLLIILLILAGIAFIGSVLLMSPKGGLGLGIGGMAGGNEYGSKKTLENKLKKVALVSGIIFLLASLILPYTK
ncbi:MAG: preprotein translocase subunit SecG [candidate division SR1 bacterium]|nr:preprotein translocase subunit SecG [candidate division SR1 bacterium]